MSDVICKHSVPIDTIEMPRMEYKINGDLTFTLNGNTYNLSTLVKENMELKEKLNAIKNALNSQGYDIDLGDT